MLLTNTLDALDGWLPADQAAAITHERAHSGRAALRVGPGQDFSRTFNRLLGQLRNPFPRRLKVSAWVWLPSAQAVATLTTLVVDPAAPNAPALVRADLAPPGPCAPSANGPQWSQTVAVPAAADAAKKLTIYLWHPGGDQPTYLDDLTVTAMP